MGSTATDIADELRHLIRVQPWVRDEIRKSCEDAAAAGASYGQTIAPVLQDVKRHPSDEPGQFKDSIHAEEAPDKDGMPRAWIVSNVSYAAYLEFGTRNMPEIGTFAQIAKHLGGDMKGARITDQTREGGRRIRNYGGVTRKFETVDVVARSVQGHVMTRARAGISEGGRR